MEEQNKLERYVGRVVNKIMEKTIDPLLAKLYYEVLIPYQQRKG